MALNVVQGSLADLDLLLTASKRNLYFGSIPYRNPVVAKTLFGTHAAPTPFHRHLPVSASLELRLKAYTQLVSFFFKIIFILFV